MAPSAPLQIDVQDKDKLIDQLHQANIGLAGDLEDLKHQYEALEHKFNLDAEQYEDSIRNLEKENEYLRNQVNELHELLAQLKALHDMEEHQNTVGRFGELGLFTKPPPDVIALESENAKLKGKCDALIESNRQNKEGRDQEFELRVDLEKQARQLKDQVETERQLRSELERELERVKNQLQGEEEMRQQIENQMVVFDNTHVVAVGTYLLLLINRTFYRNTSQALEEPETVLR
jgi:archaellum component FlaC